MGHMSRMSRMSRMSPMIPDAVGNLRRRLLPVFQDVLSLGSRLSRGYSCHQAYFGLEYRSKYYLAAVSSYTTTE